MKGNNTLNVERTEEVLDLIYNQKLSQLAVAGIIQNKYNHSSIASARSTVRRIIERHNKALEKECLGVGIPVDSVSAYWYKGKSFSIHARPGGKEVDIEETFAKVLSDYNMQPVKKVDQPTTETFDRLIFTDVHIGMDASRKGLAMYAEEWGAEMLWERINIMITKTLQCKSSDIIYIDELGDYMDGYNSMTTRGGHHLPQNMTNEEAFDLGLRIKLHLAASFSEHYKYVVFNNINNDNHSSSFSYTVNSAFKHVVDAKYTNVEVHNHKKFLSYYVVGDHCFVITHGKDDRHMKYGFKPVLDSKQIYKIDQFLKNEGIYKLAKHIEISKGDSHQCLFDMCTSDDFHYFNYAAFSPSSEWVQLNFSKGKSGFTFMSVEKYGQNKFIYPYFF
jgi:hypothetical protein